MRPTISNSKRRFTKEPRFVIRYAFYCLLSLVALWVVVVIRSHDSIVKSSEGRNNHSENTLPDVAPTPRIDTQRRREGEMTVQRSPHTAEAASTSAFDAVLERARQKRDSCQQADPNFGGFDKRHEIPWGNQTLATLPAFGIIDALDAFKQKQQPDNDQWQCKLPPETECDETQLTVIFMAYNPDRLDKSFRQIRKILSRDAFQNIVKECVLVWNGPRSIDESKEGKEMLAFAQENALRIVYPLKMGFPNDLMNRYHPHIVQVTTKAILYYDDDGPFYSYKATEAGFELWKRHSRAQIGAMSRQINYSPRQQQERQQLDPQPNDRLFVSHCDNLHDQVEYNFRYFANYDANMVLPSGSMLHSNYLCFLWHPALADIRQFVLNHPVHPDDITVSTVVSQLAGLAPRVYSRRLNPQDPTTTKAQRRRLSEEAAPPQKNRAGIGGICWDCDQGMSEKKQIWADLRSQAINTLIRYFGSINSGSIGWCQGTPYYNPNKQDGKCEPIMARQGWLPWMNLDGTPKDTCP